MGEIMSDIRFRHKLPDFKEMAKNQPKLPHANPCVCTIGPFGYVLDYDCGDELASQGIVWHYKDGSEIPTIKYENCSCDNC